MTNAEYQRKNAELTAEHKAWRETGRYDMKRYAEWRIEWNELVKARWKFGHLWRDEAEEAPEGQLSLFGEEATA